MTSPSRLKRIALILVAVLCVIRLSFFLFTYQNDATLIIDPDTQSYLDISTSMYERGKYERVAGLPETHRPPGYASYLAANYVLFGSDNLLAPVLIQHILSVLITIMVAYLAFRLGGTGAALIACVVYLLDFTSFYYLNEVLSETLFTFFIVLSLFLIHRSIDARDTRLRWFLLAGLVTTLAVFIRPVGMLLMYPTTLMVGVTVYVQSGIGRDAFKSMATFVLPWIILGGAWYFRSYIISGEFFFTNYEGEALFERLRPVLMAANDIDLVGANAIIGEMVRNGLKPVQIYFVVLAEHPWEFIKVTSLDLGRLLISPSQWHLKFYFPETFADQFAMEKLILSGNFAELGEQLVSRPAAYAGIIAFVMIHLIITYAGGLVSVVAFFKSATDDKMFYLFALLFIAYFIAITAGFIGHSRFRVPFAPVLAILCGYGLSNLLTGFKKPPVR